MVDNIGVLVMLSHLTLEVEEGELLGRVDGLALQLLVRVVLTLLALLALLPLVRRVLTLLALLLLVLLQARVEPQLELILLNGNFGGNLIRIHTLILSRLFMLV